MREAELQQAILDMARLFRWRCAHFRPARTADGSWRTAVSADGAGYPDLTLVRGPRILYAELKTETGRLSAAQEQWIAALRKTPAWVFVWRPADWLDGSIERALR